MKFATFDIEASNWTNFEVVGFYDGKEYRTFYDLGEFVDFILRPKYKGYRIYAHFGGRYDFLFLLPFLFERDLDLRFIDAGSRIIQIKVKGHDNLYLVDSYALLPYSLDKLTKAFKVKHPKKKMDFTKFIDWKDPENLKYLEHDVKGLFEVIESFRHWGENRGALKATIASQTLSLYKKFYHTEPLPRLLPIDEEFIRKTYYGGRCEIFKMYGENLRYYDINSLYPFVMLQPMPSGRVVKTGRIHKDKIGFYKVRLKIPPCYIPPVAKIMDTKLIFPCGEFEAYITSADVPSIKRVGGEIEVLDGLIFSEAVPIFKKYIQNLYKIKQKADPNSVDYLTAKLYMNSLYGRFGMKRERENIVRPKNYREVVKKGLTPYLEEYGIYKEKASSKSTFILPYIASYITSLARNYLYKCIMDIGSKHVYYCDTDSLVLDIDIKTGDQLGEWKLEKSDIKKAVFLQPKAYCLNDYSDRDFVKLKGFSEYNFTIDDFYKALKTNNLNKIQAEIYRIIGMKENIRRYKKVNIRRIKVLKQLRGIYNKRVIEDNFNTQPFNLMEE